LGGGAEEIITDIKQERSFYIYIKIYNRPVSANVPFQFDWALRTGDAAACEIEHFCETKFASNQY
jgi:hypothetical protein